MCHGKQLLLLQVTRLPPKRYNIQKLTFNICIGFKIHFSNKIECLSEVLILDCEVLLKYYIHVYLLSIMHKLTHHTYHMLCLA